MQPPLNKAEAQLTIEWHKKEMSSYDKIIHANNYE